MLYFKKCVDLYDLTCYRKSVGTLHNRIKEILFADK